MKQVNNNKKNIDQTRSKKRSVHVTPIYKTICE